MQNGTTGTTMVLFNRPQIADYRRPNIVNLSDMEEQLRKGLEGKFFNVWGLDLNEIGDEEHAKEVQRQLMAAQKRKDGEKLRQKLQARKLAYELLMKTPDHKMAYSPIVVIEAVCHAHDVTVDELLSESRFKRLVYARQHACWLLKKITGKSSTQIGTAIGRDHSTVIHALTQWEINKRHHHREIETVNEVLGLKA